MFRATGEPTSVQTGSDDQLQLRKWYVCTQAATIN